MKRISLAAAGLALALMGGASALAQAPAAAPAPPIGPDRTIVTKDGKTTLPDWTGVWTMVGNTVFDQSTRVGGAAGAPGTREVVPYNAEWQAKYVANQKMVDDDRWPDPQTACGIVAGFPRALNVPDTYEFVNRPEESWILTENGPNVVRIYTDGRKHPPADEVWPTFTGDSVGHWEGDTLVFDTIGLQGWPKKIFDRTGAIHSDELHTVTRMRRVDANTFEADIVLEDPVAFTKPWHIVKRYRRLPYGTRLYDYSCAENNRNEISPSGKTLTKDTSGKIIDKDKR